MTMVPCTSRVGLEGRPLAQRLHALAVRVRRADWCESRRTAASQQSLRPAAFTGDAAGGGGAVQGSAPGDDPLIVPVKLQRERESASMHVAGTQRKHAASPQQTARHPNSVSPDQGSDMGGDLTVRPGQQPGAATKQTQDSAAQRLSSAYGVAPVRNDLAASPPLISYGDSNYNNDRRGSGGDSGDDDNNVDSNGSNGRAAAERALHHDRRRKGLLRLGPQGSGTEATSGSSNEGASNAQASAPLPAAASDNQASSGRIWQRPPLLAAPSGFSGLVPTLEIMKPGQEGGGSRVAPPTRWMPSPVAPDDPEELLQVLQAMPHPRRRLVIFKSGGYIMSDLEELIESSGLDHVMRVTNLIRKAHCVLAKERWEDGRRVDVRQHAAGAAKRGLPFLLIKGHRLELVPLVGALRPLLVRRDIVVERPGARKLRADELGGLVWEIAPARERAAVQQGSDEDDEGEDGDWLV